MEISFNTHFLYANSQTRQNNMSTIRPSVVTPKATTSRMALFGVSGSSDEKVTVNKKTDTMKTLLRDLHKNNNKTKDLLNPYSVENREHLDALLAAPQTEKKDSSSNKYKKYNYNPNEVSNKIRQAKTALSAAQASRSARRKVLEVRRKLASQEGDTDELQLALSHAQRMENVAKKKKHNIEQEEMVARTQAKEEQADKLEEQREDMQASMVMSVEDEVFETEDEIYEARDEAVLDVAESIQEASESTDSSSEISEELVEETYEQISELGEDMLEELDDMMEMLEDMEILNPHMSKEQLDKIKTKHRNAEEKEILKANMDYLKNTIKLQNIRGTQGSGINNMSSATSGIAVAASASISMPTVSIDVSA